MKKIALPRCFLKRSKRACLAIKELKKSGFKKIVPLIYLITLVIGIVLTFIYTFIHSFVTCSSLFGTDFCTPTGIFVVLFASLPGYIISGNLLSFIKDIPSSVSFAVVILTSIVFYFLLGLLIDKFRSRKMSAENTSKFIVVVIFSILFFLLVSLL